MLDSQEALDAHSLDIEQRLKDAAARYAMMDNLLEGCQVIGFDLRYLYVNQASARHSAQSREDMLGKTILERLPGVENTHPFAVLRRCMDERVSEHLETFFVLPDGSSGWFEISIQPVPEGVFVFTLDITKRRQAHDELEHHAAALAQRVEERTAELQAEKDTLREREAIYRLLAENITDVVARSSTDGVCLYISPSCQSVMGYTPDELMGRNVIEHIHPDDMVGVNESYAAALQAGERVIVSTYRFRHKDGHYFWLESLGRPIISEETGELIGYVTSSRDITRRREAEDALRLAIKKEKELGALKSRFVSMASHEFRTPLASILALTETLSAYRHKLTEDEIDGQFARIKEQIEHLRSIMEDVLLLARMQARRVEFTPVLLDLDSLCRSVLDEFLSHPGMTHTIEYTCDSTLKHVYLDKKLLRRIISNLVSNALKYSPSGSTVTVDLDVCDGEMVLKVSDHGIGIPEADRAHLFDAFHRAENVGTISGTGLGLVITKEAVDLHRGTIMVESQVDHGTTFWVRIPVTFEEGHACGKDPGH